MNIGPEIERKTSSLSSTTEIVLSKCGEPTDFVAIKLVPETSEFVSESHTNVSKDTLWIIRGLPGSGKSTLAKELCEELSTCHWYEADMYFESFGQYFFDRNKIGEAHDWCQQSVVNAMHQHAPNIIVSNTFTRVWEITPYIEMARHNGYNINCITCTGNYKSIHNIPDEVYNNMKNRWEQYP